MQKFCEVTTSTSLHRQYESLRDFQVPYARPAAETKGWKHDMPQGGISLAEVVR